MAAIRSQTPTAPAASSARRSISASDGSRSRARISGSVDGAVEQIGAAGLAGALRGAGDVEDVVEQLEGEADLAAEGRAAPTPLGELARAPPCRRGRSGRRTRKAGGLQPAALQVALRGDRESKASRRWASSPRARPRTRRTAARPGARRRSWPSSAKARREEQVADRERPRHGPNVATTVGRPRRSGAASSTSSWTRVAMWTSSIAARRADRGSPAARPGAEQHEHRAQALAPGRERRPRVAARSRRGPRPARRSRSSTASIRVGSQASAASSTTVTGGGTAVRFTILASSPASGGGSALRRPSG